MNVTNPLTIKHAVIRQDDEVYHYDFDMDMMVCSHVNAYIEKACCSSVGSSGYIECGCGGRDALICPNPQCTDIMDHEIDELFERLS